MTFIVKFFQTCHLNEFLIISSAFVIGHYDNGKSRPDYWLYQIYIIKGERMEIYETKTSYYSSTKITTNVDFVLSDDGTVSQKVCPWSTDDVLRAKEC